MPKFTVDTHLFRELGELLVGRDSTALVELIKNSYDADATQVVVFAQDLATPERGFIRVSDDGIGMNRSDFEKGFLRIASRAKEVGDRRSPRLHRRYTGAKGIGRLAAHKLARILEIESFPWQQTSVGGLNGVEGSIDWDLIENYETLDQVEDDRAIVLRDFPQGAENRTGTTITLRKLRRKWTSVVHGRFLGEVQTFEMPEWLGARLPRTVVKAPLLFDKPIIRDVVGDGQQTSFRVELTGDLAPPEDFWTATLAAATWVLEIVADEMTGKVNYAVAPTLRALEELPEAKPVTYTVTHPTPEAGPYFHARILIRTGVLRGASAVRAWMGTASGVRVFMEGFRVLPYGEARNDWLALDRDVTERGRGLLARPEGDILTGLFEGEESFETEGLLHLPNKHYFGGVFLTESRARSLRMLVNREGFVPEAGYETLVSLVRAGIDIATRARAAATSGKRAKRKAERAANRAEGASTERMPTAMAVRSAVQEAQGLASEARVLLTKGNPGAAAAKVTSALGLVEHVAEVSDELVREGAMLRVLASVGTQLATFVHEVTGLLGMAQALEGAVDRLRRSVKLKPDQRKALAEFGKATADLRRSLERHASYLIDVVTPDARRRRTRQSLAERFDAGVRLVASSAERRNIAIQNGIPRELRSPPMFPAELTTVFANLLTNAVKAAGQNGRVRATGAKRRDGGSTLRIENTGAAVRSEEGERWFRPFESSTAKVDPVLGQGMGLGLPITRSVLEEYGATIRFTDPRADFVTAIEIFFPE